MNYVFGEYWKLDKKITSGSFGEVFIGKHIATGEEVAIKLEPVSSSYNQLLMESAILLRLKDEPGVPKVRWYGTNGPFNVLIMDLLGYTIQELFFMCQKTFSLKTVLMIAEQAISRIESLHSYHLIHRDIKPENFLIGKNQFENIIYLIDFGLSKRYKKSPKNHIKYKQGKGFTGNQRFCSNNALLGIEQSRRDDLEALGYMLIYLLSGSLPWGGIANTSQMRKEELIKRKVCATVQELCFLCPPEFSTYMNYVKSLEFTAKPDYAYIKRLFRGLFFKMNFEFDYNYDWKASCSYKKDSAALSLKRSWTQNNFVKDAENQNDEKDDRFAESNNSCIII